MITAILILSVVNLLVSTLSSISVHCLHLNVGKLEKKMATLQEKLDELTATLNDGLTVVTNQIATIEAQVEQLFAIIANGQLTPEQEAQVEALKTNIQAGLELLRSGVEQIGVDDPNV